ncbi:MAG: hypothetical protein [Circular genetic element sp.]|nr:MAG: hypothetical protein [Circular genetic element sp.]
MDFARLTICLLWALADLRYLALRATLSSAPLGRRRLLRLGIYINIFIFFNLLLSCPHVRVGETQGMPRQSHPVGRAKYAILVPLSSSPRDGLSPCGPAHALVRARPQRLC